MSHTLNHSWTIYAHDKKDIDWTKIAYKQCYTIRTIEDFWRFFNNFHDFTRHQFYIMKGSIKPTFECPQNKNGGSIGWLLQRKNFKDKRKNNTDEIIVDFILRLVLDLFLPDKATNNEITGLVINPKQNQVVLKLWFRNYDWLKKKHWSVNIRGFFDLYSKRVSKHIFSK